MTGSFERPRPPILLDRAFEAPERIEALVRLSVLIIHPAEPNSTRRDEDRTNQAASCHSYL